jgi:hypothetical protein
VTPSFEPLERRDAPTWAAPLVTISVVPDGTPWSGGRSALVAALDRQRPGWREVLARVAAEFSAATGLAVALVPDSGAPINATGKAQGDARFGDIRIGATPAEPTVLGWTFDPHPGNGTVAGDVTLNAAQDWDPSDGAGFDLASVLRHELGHAFGLGHSGEPGSVMSPAYRGPTAGLGEGDRAALRDLYRLGESLATPADLFSKFRGG